EPAHEIMGEDANATLQPRQAKRTPDGRGEPRIRCWRRRPYALVEAAKDHEILMRQPRLDQTANGNARMAALGRAHGDAVEQVAEQPREGFHTHDFGADLR